MRLEDGKSKTISKKRVGTASTRKRSCAPLGMK